MKTLPAIFSLWLCGCGLAAKPTQQANGQSVLQAAKSNEPDKKPVEWAQLKNAVVIDSVRVEISDIYIGKVPLKSYGDEPDNSAEKMLAIKVKITNTNDKKKPSYQSWGADRGFAIDAGFATVSDDLGNTYKRVAFPTAPLGSSTNVSLYPGKPATDVLVFETPLPKAKHLDIEMPAENFEAKGVVRFRVPLKSVRN